MQGIFVAAGVAQVGNVAGKAKGANQRQDIPGAEMNAPFLPVEHCHAEKADEHGDIDAKSNLFFKADPGDKGHHQQIGGGKQSVAGYLNGLHPDGLKKKTDKEEKPGDSTGFDFCFGKGFKIFIDNEHHGHCPDEKAQHIDHARGKTGIQAVINADKAAAPDKGRGEKGQLPGKTMI